jgi:hypothetical protein
LIFSHFALIMAHVNGLIYLERWIEQLVEEPFVRLFAGRLLPQDVVRHLMRALEDGERVGADGVPEVPGRYRIELNPDDLKALTLHHPDLKERLTEALSALVDRIELRTHDRPAIILVASPDLAARDVRITPADRVAPIISGTQDLDASRLEQAALIPREEKSRAYVIIEGGRSVDLDQPAVTIGRALDNDIILEDRQVSRHHVRLRQRYGRYILQDLGSSGGTTVNGFPVQEIVLRHGDVISLSGVDLIYAESEPLERPERGYTQPIEHARD